MNRSSLITSLVIIIILLSISVTFLTVMYKSVKPAADKWAIIEKNSSAFIKKKEKIIEAANKNGQPFLSDPFSDPAYAIKYVNTYQSLKTELTAIENKTDYTKTAWVDFETWCNLIKLLVENDGDGARLYFSKYDKYDAASANRDILRGQPTGDKGAYDYRFSVIIGATEPDGDTHKTFWVKKEIAGVPRYDGIYNYNELCPPNTNCVGSDIPIDTEKSSNKPQKTP